MNWFVLLSIIGYSHGGGKNYITTNDQIKLDGGVESHTALRKHEKFAEYLKTIPAIKKARKPINLDKVIEKDPNLK